MVTIQELLDKKSNVAVVGLGYVGLPLAVHLSKYFSVIGFDAKTARVDALKAGHDATGEISDQALKSCAAHFTANGADLAKASVIIVAVPTPIDAHNQPDLTPLEKASANVGKYLQRGAVVVYESTVYPGVTEEVCLPILEKESGLKFGRDFTLGYSPERINPGDKVNTLESIMKIVSGSDPATLDLLAGVYGQVVKAGIHRASSIKVAEAAKVIENTQRDINIALINELSIIFDRLGIDTQEVLQAAGTKWNFMNFRPGLVGGHCIGVDPYYLTYKAQEAGYHPEIILAGRRINDNMGKYVAEKCIKLMIHQGCRIKDAKVGIMGLTFKENVPDLRNTRVVDIVSELASYNVQAVIHDPMASPEEARHEYNIDLCGAESFSGLDAIILAVPHEAYRSFTPEHLKKCFANPAQALLLDLKGFYKPEDLRSAGVCYWRL